MTNHDVDPAEAEPNSIGPTAFDTNQWKIDLDDLHSGVRFDFSVPPQVDGDDLGLPSEAPRRGRRVLGVMAAVAVVAGLGVAAFVVRPSLQRAAASSRVAQTTMIAAPPVVVPPPVIAAPPAQPPAPAVQATPAPAALTPADMANVSTKAAKGRSAKPGKRAPGKRGAAK